MTTGKSLSLVAVALAGVAAALPYASGQEASPPPSVLGSFSAEQIAAGRAIFYRIGTNGCVHCHAPYASGDEGPSIRGADEGMVRAAADGIDKMTPQQRLLRDADFAAVGMYLKWLGTIRLTTVVLRRGTFDPPSVDVRPGTPIQLAVENTGLIPQTITGDGLGVSVTVPARGRMATFFAAPDTEGKYELTCSDCQRATFTVNVTLAAPETINVPPGTKVSPASGN
jgi:hypothetical protein